MISIKINDKVYQYEENISYYEITKDFNKNYKDNILLVKVNGNIKELFTLAQDKDEVEFIFYDTPVGRNAYVTSTLFVIYRAVHDNIFKKYNMSSYLKFTNNGGYYITPKDENFKYTKEDFENIKKSVNDMIKDKLKFVKHTTDAFNALNISEKLNLNSKKLLFKFSSDENINYYTLGQYLDVFYTKLLYDTSFILNFKLVQYKNGLIVTFPKNNTKDEAIDFSPVEKIFEIQTKDTMWLRDLDVNNVGKLNQKIANNEFNDLVILQEAYQEKSIADIAKSFYDSKKKIILISGPTSSGKTSFSYRLAYHLKALGINALQVSCDNFFVNREDSPRDENGEYDYESIENVDMDELNKDLIDLINGKEVKLPIFDFTVGERVYGQNLTKINENQVIILEGIHCLNDKLTYKISKDDKFKIYISPLTLINIDDFNRIPTTDLRLLRRIVRDNRTRNTTARETIKRWASIKKGEEKNIFPFQENADCFFNSSLLYELSILKTYAEPLLFDIDKNCEEYLYAHRLLRYLKLFLCGTEEAIPKYSIIKEFIGGSILNAV